RQGADDVAVVQSCSVLNALQLAVALQERAVDAAAVHHDPARTLALEGAVRGARHEQLRIRLQRDVVRLGKAVDSYARSGKRDVRDRRAVGPTNDENSRLLAQFHRSPIARPWLCAR